MTCTVLCPGTGNPGSLIVPQYKSYKITVFVWDEAAILKFARNTYYEKSMKPTLPLVLAVLIMLTQRFVMFFFGNF